MGWEQLKEMIDSNRRAQGRAAGAAPVACPVCGNPLDVGKGGVRNCDMGHYRWPN